MNLPFADFLSSALESISSTAPRPGLHPIPGTSPLTVEAAILPPLVYYVALLFLPTSPPPVVDSATLKVLRNTLAAVAGFLFFRLPLAYHVPQSIGLTYQLGLVGLYGGCRVVDAFFISPYLFGHVPRRVHYTYVPRPEAPLSKQKLADISKEWSDGGLKDPFHGKRSLEGMIRTPTVSRPHTPVPIASDDIKKVSSNTDWSTMLSSAFQGPEPRPVYETARTEPDHPTTFLERASWALDLELSMRGIGFTWTTADVRHTRRTWLPTVSNRIHSIIVHTGPVLVGSWAIIKSIYMRYLSSELDLFAPKGGVEIFDANMPLGIQLILTLGLGAFLMAAFSLGHSLFAIMCAPLAPSPLAFFPPLYSMRVWKVTSVRKFWSFGWHRLFARLFLVYGVWPGEWVERKLTGKGPEEPADFGKVLGGFISSGLVHSFAVRGVVGGQWLSASGESKFFALNGCAVVVEEIVKRLVMSQRKKRGTEAPVWYDAWIGRMWWISVLLFTGRNFARGWVKSGLVREMAFM